MADLSALTDEELDILQSQGLSGLSDEALDRLEGIATPASTPPPAPAQPSDVPTLNNPVTGRYPNRPFDPVRSLVERAPQPVQAGANLAMEAVAGFNRPMAAVADVAMSPAQFVLQQAGVEDPTLSGRVGQRGDFAGEGLATDIASATGEIASFSSVVGAGTRAISRGLQELTPYGETTMARVLESMGKTTPVQEIAGGAVAGGGGEVSAEAAAQVFGEDYREGGRLAGQVLSPTAWFATTDLIRSAVRNTAPSVEVLRGGSRALYKLLDDAGLQANGPSIASMQNRINKFIVDQGLTPAATTGPVKTKLTQLLKDAENGNVTYGMLDEVHGVLRGMGKGNDHLGVQAKAAAEMLDDMIMNMAVTDTSALGGKEVREVITAARGLWRRASVAQTMDDAVQAATLKTEINGSSFVKNYRTELGRLLKKGTKDGKFLTKEEKTMMREVIKGGRVENMLHMAENLGFSSNDLVRSILVGGAVGGAVGSASGNTAAGLTATGAAILGSTALSAIFKAGANKLFKNNANYLRSVIKAGPDANELVRTYYKYTPRNERDPAQLARLFLSSQANIAALQASGKPTNALVTDAILLGLGGQRLMQEEDEAQQPPQ